MSQYIKARFADLLSDSKNSGQETLKTDYRRIIIESAEQQYTLGKELSRHFATDITKATIIEYFLLIEQYTKDHRGNGGKNSNPI